MDDNFEGLAQIVRENTKPIFSEVKAPKFMMNGDDVADNDGAPIALIPEGMRLESLKSVIDEWRTTPERRKGIANVGRLDSFIDLTNRFKDENSALFAKGTVKGKTITAELQAVLDYHPAAPESKSDNARFCQHRVHYSFPVSKEFQAWINEDGKAMDQTEFAALIEDRIGDIIGNDPQNPVNFDGFDILKPNFADPARMLELSRGMEVFSSVTVKGKSRLSSGETQIEFVTEHKDNKGNALNPPDFFLICVPVFEMGAKYRLPVRLRYRIHEGKVLWFYQLYRAEKAFDNAFDEACKKAQTETTLPIFWGTP